MGCFLAFLGGLIEHLGNPEAKQRLILDWLGCQDNNSFKPVPAREWSGSLNPGGQVLSGPSSRSHRPKAEPDFQYGDKDIASSALGLRMGARLEPAFSRKPGQLAAKLGYGLPARTSDAPGG